MKEQIEKKMLVEMVKQACTSCYHKECTDCIIRHAKFVYDVTVDINFKR